MADADLKAFDGRSTRTVTIQKSRRWQPYAPRRRNNPPLVP